MKINLTNLLHPIFVHIRWFIFALALIYAITPIYWLFSTAIKTDTEIFNVPIVWIPIKPTLSNLVSVLSNPTFYNYLFNSIVIATLSSLVTVFIGALAAYSLTRFDFKYVSLALLSILIVQMIPSISVVLAIFIIFKNIRLVDTRIALIIVHSAFNLPMTIWILKGFFDDIPRELDEAGLVDGCSYFKLFYKILLPLLAPGLVVSFIFAFIRSWNEFLFAVMLTYTRASQTLPILISGFISDRGIEWGTMSAVGSLVILPVIILSLYIQKYLVRGLTAGAIK